MRRERVRRMVLTAAAAAGLFVAPTAARAQESEAAHLTLAEAVRRALATHPAVTSAAAGVDRAEAAAAEARSARLPRLASEVTGQRFEEPMLVSPIHAFTPDLIPSFDRTLVQGQLSATWLLFDGGARSARIHAALAHAGAASASADATLGALLARVVRSYLDVSGARETVAAHDARIAALAAARAQTQQLFDEGRVPRLALLRADAAASAARADRLSAAAVLREREAELARLVGADAADIASLSLEDVAPAATAEARAEGDWRAAAMDGDPAVERARQQESVARAAVREARASRWPSLSLAGRHHGYGDGDFDFTTEWQGGVQLSWSLFDGGARVHHVERARADERAAVAATQLARLDAAAAVDRALTALAEATARGEALDAAVAQYEEVVSVERLALNAGAGVQTDYLSAESDLLATRAALVTARHARTAALVELARATGELSPHWLTQNLEIRR